MNYRISFFAVRLAAVLTALCVFTGSGQASEGGEGHHKHTLALFTGVTHVHDENEATIGLELAFNIKPNWSIGILLERAEREEDTSLILVGAEWHPTDLHNLGLQLAVGRKDPSGEKENVIRAGIGYEIPLGESWFIKPFYARDFIEDHDDEDVFGAYIGFGF